MNDQNTQDQYSAKDGTLITNACETCPFAQIGNVMSDSCRLGRSSAAFIQKVLPKKSIVVAQGARQDGLIAVVQGVLKVSKSLKDGRTQIVGLKFPGEIVSTRSNDGSWFATVEVAQDAVLCFLDAATVEDLTVANPEFERRMHDHASRELANKHAQLVTLGRKHPTERLATFLMELEQRYGRDRQADDEIFIPISRDDIGDYLGLESETVSRQFTRLKANGVIELLSPNLVVLLDREAIRRLSEGERILAAE